MPRVRESAMVEGILPWGRVEFSVAILKNVCDRCDLGVVCAADRHHIGDAITGFLVLRGLAGILSPLVMLHGLQSHWTLSIVSVPPSFTGRM